jgi:hypothetical protein
MGSRQEKTARTTNVFGFEEILQQAFDYSFTVQAINGDAIGIADGKHRKALGSIVRTNRCLE